MEAKDKTALQGEPLDDQELEAATGGGNYGYYGYRDSQKKRCPRCGGYYMEGTPCPCGLKKSLGLGQQPDWMDGPPDSPSHSLRGQLAVRLLPGSKP